MMDVPFPNHVDIVDQVEVKKRSRILIVAKNYRETPTAAHMLGIEG
jgi:hypothetical protein